VGKAYRICPVPELVAPFIVAELLRDLYAKIQKLHLYPALVATYVLHNIVTTPKKTAQFFPFNIRNVNTIKSAVFEFPGDELGIDMICFYILFLPLAVNIGRVGNHRVSAKLSEATVGRISAATAFIGNAHLMSFKVLLDIVIKGFSLGRHGKRFTAKKIGGAMNFPT